MQRSVQVDLARGITTSYRTSVDEEDECDDFDVDNEITGSVGGDSYKGEENEADCERSSLVCERYDVRLVWVDQETGAYSPLQRRTYACYSTWSGYLRWTSKQVDHLMEECERQQCRCGLHQVAFPLLIIR
jgi:hypothetical protein